VWSWHAEQKIIRYLKKYLGIEARATLEALGITHIGGPRNPTTADKGTNYCEVYLCQKYVKYSRPEADPQFNVAAYW
jgi:hypothetical protein